MGLAEEFLGATLSKRRYPNTRVFLLCVSVPLCSVFRMTL